MESEITLIHSRRVSEFVPPESFILVQTYPPFMHVFENTLETNLVDNIANMWAVLALFFYFCLRHMGSI